MSSYNRNDVKTMQAAKGRWYEILTAAGIDAKFLNGKSQACPLCREGTDRFTYTNKFGDGNYVCRHCKAGTGFTLLAKWQGLDPKRDFKKVADQIDGIIGNRPVAIRPATMNRKTIRDQEEKRQRDDAKLKKQEQMFLRNFNASRPVEAGDVVDLYLANRAINLRASAALRFHPNCFNWITQVRYPAMLALFRGPQQEKLIPNMQITFLTEDGHKAGVTPPRLNLAGSMPEGGAIRLQPAAAVMGIAEGVESAMSAAQMFDMPVWAATSGVLLAKWRVPDIVTHLVIYADNDEHDQGMAAAESLARRVLFEADRDGIPRTVDIKMPESVGQDWNDILQQQGEQHARVEA